MQLLQQASWSFFGLPAFKITSKAKDKVELIMAYDAVCEDPSVLYCEMDVKELELVIIREVLVK